jgi:hypothetical protein
MENNKKQMNQQQPPVKTFNKPRLTEPGQFQTDHQGRIINNRTYGIDGKLYSWDTLYKKTPEEKAQCASMISSYNQLMRTYYGENWKSRKGANRVFNVPVSIDKQTLKYQLSK